MFSLSILTVSNLIFRPIIILFHLWFHPSYVISFFIYVLVSWVYCNKLLQTWLKITEINFFHSSRGQTSEIKLLERLVLSGGSERESVPCPSPSFCIVHINVHVVFLPFIVYGTILSTFFFFLMTYIFMVTMWFFF